MNDKRLFLLDAYALIYRAYYALIRAPRMGKKGFNAAAIYGFCNTLDEVLRKFRPSHIAVCFDPKGPTFRDDIYPQYKAKRQAQPEDITLAIPYIKDIIRAYNIEIIEKPGFEADDVIGTLAGMAEREGYITYMMTPDKDYGQLVTDKIFMLRPSLAGKDAEIRGPKEICERYGIESPHQVIDLLALEGDSSDNIPGCRGIGEKTASKLIREWGSVENLINHASELKGSLKLKISENVEDIRLSYDLATIRTDVPLQVDFNDLRKRPENTDKLREIFAEFDFKSLISRLDKNAGSGNSESALLFSESPQADDAMEKKPESELNLFDFIDNQPIVAARKIDIDVTLVNDPEEASKIIVDLRAKEFLGLSVYAVGNNVISASVNAVILAPDKAKAYYFYLSSQEEPRRKMIEAIQPVFTSAPIVVSPDFKRDYIMLSRAGFDVTCSYFDTSVAHYVLQPEMRHGFADVAMTLLGVAVPEPPEQRSRQMFPPFLEEEAMNIFGVRAAIALDLRSVLAADIERASLHELLYEIELPFTKVLADMEITGVRIDTEELSRLSASLTARLNEKERRVFELAGTSFNIGSPTQVGEILFGQMKIDPKAKKTRKGAYSTTEEILEKFRHEYEIVDLILQIRGLKKLLTTYINALPELINPKTGKIHTTFNQTVTATGRISSVNPNLQNIPIRTDDGREIRRAFIPDPGCIFLSADYSQIELRLMAHLSGDHAMIDAFVSGEDIHRATAAKIFGITPSDVTENQRRQAKTANFGIIYGISQFGLAERLGIPRSEAKALIEGYFNSYPYIRAYINNAVVDAHENRFVTTMLGRKRFLPDINSRNNTVRSYAERNAVNAPIQGTAADIIKIAMNRIHARIASEGLKSRMILQVHDELCFNVVPEELERLKSLVIYEMEHAISLKVKLEVSAGIGNNWLEAH